VLANHCPDTIEEAMHAACTGLERVGHDSDLCFTPLRQTRLSI
jgi:hypothetical protein